MIHYKCPQYSGQGAAAGHATCEFFASMDARPGVKWSAITVLLIAALFCVRYLRR